MAAISIMSSRARLTWIEPSFPPLLSGRCVVKGDHPLQAAVEGAAAGQLGAGDTLWLQDDALVSLAIVLEPEVAMRKAAQMLPVAVVAAGDCIGALTPPQVAVHFRWPATLLVNGAVAGDCHLVAPDLGPEHLADWLVLGVTMRLAFAPDPGDGDGPEPGATPGITALAEEGCEDLTTGDVLESYSRHFLSWLDTWQSEGFGEVSDNWIGRAEHADAIGELHHPTGSLAARVLTMDEDGSLIVKPEQGDARALALIECVEHAARFTSLEARL